MLWKNIVFLNLIKLYMADIINIQLYYYLYSDTIFQKLQLIVKSLCVSALCPPPPEPLVR